MDNFQSKIVNEVKLDFAKKDIIFGKIMIPAMFFTFLVCLSNMYTCNYKNMAEFVLFFACCVFMSFVVIMFNRILFRAIKEREEVLADIILDEL